MHSLSQQERMRQNTFGDCVEINSGALDFRVVDFTLDPPLKKELPLERSVARYPFVPADNARLAELCFEAFNIQAHGLRQRLQATDEAIQTVKPALVAFTNSLSDEQKARFNEVGAQLGQPKEPRTAKQSQAEANCSGEKAGISNLAINRIEDTVRPTETQGAALDKLVLRHQA